MKCLQTPRHIPSSLINMCKDVYVIYKQRLDYFNQDKTT